MEGKFRGEDVTRGGVSDDKEQVSKEIRSEASTINHVHLPVH